MKKKRGLFLGLIGALALVSCKGVDNLMEKGKVDQEDIKVSPKSVIGYVGDPMPFYDDGKMNIFYLQDGRNTNLGYHPFALMTTNDFVNYDDYGEVIPFSNSLDSPDFALGTGSVIKDNSGLYHCYYTGHNSRKDVGLPYFEIIQHATSTDKIHWDKHPEDGFYGNNNDFRDPYVYYGEDDIYHMLITTRDKGTGVIKEYTSFDLKKWNYKDIFFKNDSGTYNMECPTFIKFNDYYYLSFSEQGSTRVTHYRYKKNLNDSWIKPSVDFVDGEGLYAGRIEKDDSKLYMFGWCATRIGEYDTGEFDWGGNLIVHELTQKEDGTLNSKLIDSVKDKLNTQVSYKLKDGSPISKMNFNKNEMKAYVLESLSKNITRISFDIEFENKSGSLGLSFNTIANDNISNEVLLFNLDTNYVLGYANALTIDDLGKIDVYAPYKYENKNIHIEIIIDGQIIETYINSEIALTTRFYDMPKNSFSFFVNKSDAKFTNIKFFE